MHLTITLVENEIYRNYRGLRWNLENNNPQKIDWKSFFVHVASKLFVWWAEKIFSAKKTQNFFGLEYCNFDGCDFSCLFILYPQIHKSKNNSRFEKSKP